MVRVLQNVEPHKKKYITNTNNFKIFAYRWVMKTKYSLKHHNL